jgi:hypothetical protein
MSPERTELLKVAVPDRYGCRPARRERQHPQLAADVLCLVDVPRRRPCPVGRPSSADAAVEAAAVEFQTDIKKPIAIRRREIA